MIRCIYCICMLLLGSCDSYEDVIRGKWKLESRSHEAIFNITEEDGSLNALILYYNDGTTRYKHNNTKRHYALKNLKKKKGVYVDGMTGATKLAHGSSPTEIKMLSPDTAEMTTYVMNRPIQEILTRIK